MERRELASMPHSELMGIISPLLSDVDTEIDVTRSLIERMGARWDEPKAQEEAKQILRIISSNITPHSAITKMVTIGF